MASSGPGDVVGWHEPGADRMLTMRGDSVRYLGVRFDNGADGSGCRLEPPEEPQVVPRRGTRALKGHRHAPRGNPTCCQAPARSALDARSEFFTGVDPVTGGSCRWADWTTGPTRVHHARGAVEFDVREGRRHRCAGSNPAEGTNPYSIRTCTCWSPAPGSAFGLAMRRSGGRGTGSGRRSAIMRSLPAPRSGVR